MTAFQQYQTALGESVRTFDNDEKLPSLPVPPLEHTIQRYLESVKPFAKNEEEYLQTRRKANTFLYGIGEVLNRKLLQLASNRRNWLEQWWEDYAYLTLREPLIPHYNMSGAHPKVPGYQYGPGQQVKLASAYCFQLVQFWKLLRSERLKPAVNKNNQKLSMDQFRRLFNCCVIPGVTKDTIKSFFKTENDGSCSSNVAVLSNGHIFVVDGLRPDGQPLTPLEWEHQLTVIKRTTADKIGMELSYLACDNRTSWAQNRQHLLQLAPENSQLFSLLDAAMFVVCLDNSCPDSEAVISQEVLCGDYSCRWPDAATNIIFFSNGLSGGLCLHSAFDGIVSGILSQFAYIGVSESIYKWLGLSVSQALSEPQQLNFVVDLHILAVIEQVKLSQKTEKKQISINREEFNVFGKERIQKLNVHPDSFIQMALQLAYYKLHSRFSPCYETATTRAFYHGRTETVRSCSEECVLWVKSMVNSQAKDTLRALLLQKAIQKHNQLMAEARMNRGCDRHLLGLYCVAVENGIPIPDLYQDPLFNRSGGGGNFTLSTSLLGYTPLSGGVAPMCLNGYGIFYNILPKSLIFTISVHRESFETSFNKLFQYLSESLQDMACLLENQPSAKL